MKLHKNRCIISEFHIELIIHYRKSFIVYRIGGKWTPFNRDYHRNFKRNVHQAWKMMYWRWCEG